MFSEQAASTASRTAQYVTLSNYINRININQANKKNMRNNESIDVIPLAFSMYFHILTCVLTMCNHTVVWAFHEAFFSNTSFLKTPRPCVAWQQVCVVMVQLRILIPTLLCISYNWIIQDYHWCEANANLHIYIHIFIEIYVYLASKLISLGNVVNYTTQFTFLYLIEVHSAISFAVKLRKVVYQNKMKLIEVCYIFVVIILH